ncbi:MAG: Brp/Blh family beta-carotene 15,15'-dioxygenase [Candidatus Caenarcaniphilales bacterium]|nr:Brp/Blh family beta-carotene 15,15'-dioxygenase [Candidatus Caenarcaniphilales bacterium]
MKPITDLSVIPPKENALATSSGEYLNQNFIMPCTAIYFLVSIISSFLPAQFSFLQQVLLAVSILIFGLSHGATDHKVPFQLQNQPLKLIPFSAFTAFYILLVFAYAGVWLFNAPLAFGLFALLSWWHFGAADLWSLQRLESGLAIKYFWQKLAIIILWGGTSLLLPALGLYQAEYLKFFETIARNLNVDLGFAVFDNLKIFTPSILAIYGSLVGVSVIFVYLTRLVHSASRLKIIVDILEKLSFFASLALLPPLLAIGFYLSLWHAPRHIARLLLLKTQTRQLIESEQLLPALSDFFRESSTQTILAFGLLGMLYLIIPHKPTNFIELSGLFIILISALTFPHALIVLWMDSKQKLWG